MRNTVPLFPRHRVPAWSVFSDFDRLFDRVLENQGASADGALSAKDGSFHPAGDLRETEQAYLLSFDVPGLKKEDLRIDVSGNVLTIAGERKREFEGDDGGVRRLERSFGKFERLFQLPKTVAAEKIEARLEDGVLKIALPKAEEVKPRTIEIQSGPKAE